MPSPDSIRFLALVFPLGLLIYGIFRKPIYVSIGYMCLVYFKTSAYFPSIAAIQGELVFAIIACLSILIKKNPIYKLSLRYSKINKYLYFFSFCLFLSYFVAIDREFAWDNAVYHYIKVLVLYFMVISTIDTREDLNIFLFGTVLMYAYLSYEPIYGFITGTGGSEHAYGTNYIAELGLLSGHVSLANNMNQMMPIAFFLAVAQDGKFKKVLSYLSLVIFIGALVGSGSRGGVVGFVAFCGLLVFFLRDNKKLLRLAVPGAVLVFLISATFLYTASRISTGQIEGRLTGLIHGIEMVRLKYHMLGVGPGCFRLARGMYFGFTMDAHNLFGELIGELGVPGTLAWFFLMFQTYKNLLMVRRGQKANTHQGKYFYYLATGLLISLLVRLIVGLGSHGLYFFYWYIIAGLSAIMVKLSGQETGKTGSETNET
jgi:hypothetical protein